MPTNPVVVVSSKVAVPKLPYSQAIRAGDSVFVSGQVALDANGQLVGPNDVRAQIRFILTNLGHILEAAGSGLDRVVRTTVFLVRLEDFDAMNEVYRTFFPQNPPARSTVRADLMRPGLLVEIDAIAVV